MRQLSAQCLCVGGSVRSSVHVGALRRRVCVCASECVCVFVSFCACGSRFYLDMLCIGQVSTWPAARGPLVSIPFAALTTMLRYPCGECWVALAVLGLGSRVECASLIGRAVPRAARHTDRTAGDAHAASVQNEDGR